MKITSLIAGLSLLASSALSSTPVFPAGTNHGNIFFIGDNIFWNGLYATSPVFTNSVSIDDETTSTPTLNFLAPLNNGSITWFDGGANFGFLFSYDIHFRAATATQPITINGHPVLTNVPLSALPAGVLTNAGGTTDGLPLTGGTVSGPVLTTSPTTNAPANNELASALWVRNLFNVGADYYITTNIDNVATNVGSDQVVYTFASTIPVTNNRVYLTTDFLTNNGYVGSVMTTNAFQSLGGVIDIHAVLAFTGGGGGPTLTMHPEIYYSYDKTNWQGDFASQPTVITPGQTNIYDWSITFPKTTSTNATGFYVERRYKVDSVTGTGTRTLRVLVGTNSVTGPNDAAHITMQSPTANVGNAFLNANQTFTGSNNFTGPVVMNLASTNLTFPTNAGSQTIDFANGHFYMAGFSTNANFAFLGFANINPTNYNERVTFLTNYNASPITFTVPANCHSMGTLNCTGVTEIVWSSWANQWSNCFSLPLW